MSLTLLSRARAPELDSPPNARAHSFDGDGGECHGCVVAQRRRLRGPRVGPSLRGVRSPAGRIGDVSVVGLGEVSLRCFGPS